MRFANLLLILKEAFSYSGSAIGSEADIIPKSLSAFLLFGNPSKYEFSKSFLRPLIMFWIRHPMPVVSGRAVPEQIVQYEHRLVNTNVLVVDVISKKDTYVEQENAELPDVQHLESIKT